MNLYLTGAQIPELASLTPTQRLVVSHGAFSLLRKEHPFAYWSAGIPGGIGGAVGALVGWLIAQRLPEDSNYRLVAIGGSAAIFGGCGGFIGGQLLVRQVRPYYRRFIEEHKVELLRTA